MINSIKDQVSYTSFSDFFSDFISYVRQSNYQVARQTLGRYSLDMLLDLDELTDQRIQKCEEILCAINKALLKADHAKIEKIASFDYSKIDLFQTEESAKKGDYLDAEECEKGGLPECEKGESFDLTESDLTLIDQMFDAPGHSQSSLISSYTPITTTILPLTTPSNITLKEHIKNSSRGPETSLENGAEVICFGSFKSSTADRRGTRHIAYTPDRAQPTDAPKKRLKQAEQIIASLPNPFARSWDHIKADDHFLTTCVYSNHVKHNSGNVQSFRISFSPEREAILLKSAKPTTEAARWVREAFIEAFGEDIPHAFKLELSEPDKKTGKCKLHAHGIAHMPEKSTHKSPETVLKRSLLKASGNTSKSSNSDCRGFYDGFGYYAYLTKAEKQTRAALRSDKLTYINKAMRDQARAYHAEMRGEPIPAKYNIGFICSLDYRFISGSRRIEDEAPPRSKFEAVGGRKHESVISRIAS